jgi:hypothetical protein
MEGVTVMVPQHPAATSRQAVSYARRGVMRVKITCTAGVRACLGGTGLASSAVTLGT